MDTWVVRLMMNTDDNLLTTDGERHDDDNDYENPIII